MFPMLSGTEIPLLWPTPGGSTRTGTAIKGCSLGKVENHWLGQKSSVQRGAEVILKLFSGDW